MYIPINYIHLLGTQQYVGVLCEITPNNQK